MKTFFTSDTHFFHKNILNFSHRPYETIEEMNEGLIDKWNSVVSNHDRVFHLGDFSFSNADNTLSVLERLNGKKFLILGNHDNVMTRDAIKNHFESVKEYSEIRCEDQKIVMFHYPIAEWNGMQHGSWHLYGHVHGSLEIAGKALDVGIDGPISNHGLLSFDQIKEYMDTREIRNHHNK